MERSTQRLEGVMTGFTYYINEEDGDILRHVYIDCPCGREVYIEEMQAQDVIECPDCPARYTGTYKGWEIFKLREEANGDSKDPDADSAGNAVSQLH